MARPVLLAVDHDPSSLAEIGRELEDRYGRHYEVVCLRSPDDARERLTEYATSGVEVALVLAAPVARRQRPAASCSVMCATCTRTPSAHC